MRCQSETWEEAPGLVRLGALARRLAVDPPYRRLRHARVASPSPRFAGENSTANRDASTRVEDRAARQRMAARSKAADGPSMPNGSGSFPGPVLMRGLGRPAFR